jgi:ATP-binding cassette subfamily F protein uup
MAVLLNVHELRHSFASRPLFEGLTFSIETGEKIALIGANGAGKSTLMKIMAGMVDADSGKVARARGLKVGYLSQVPTFPKGQTVREAVLGDAMDSGDWALIGMAEEIMSRLELTGGAVSYEDRLVSELSGGWQKKVALAREIAREPDVLLLDEPTNHLDIESVLWLEEWVKQSPQCVVNISHDRAYLRSVGQRVIEIDKRNPDGILSVQGNYDYFLQVKSDFIEAQESRLSSMKNTMRRELEWLGRGAKARTTKQKARIDRAFELQDDVKDLSFKTQRQTVKLDFEGMDKNPKKLVELKKVSKAYGNRVLLKDFSMLITPKTRLGLLGRNGAGKSTLAKIISGDVKPDSGEVIRADRAQVLYFEQSRETLDQNLTVLKTICPSGETVEYQGRMMHVRSYMDRFLFGTDQMDLKVGKLSGGEQARLLIALLMLKPANILILDEPTNDLDLATLAVLEDCLEQYDGAVILVSHDRAFMDQVCSQILLFPEFISFAGIEQWETWRKDSSRGNQSRGGAQAFRETESSSAPTPSKTSGKKLSFKEQREFDTMEATILEKETKLEALQTESQDPKIASNSIKLAPLMKEMAALQAEIETLYARWSELESMGAKKS